MNSEVNYDSFLTEETSRNKMHKLKKKKEEEEKRYDMLNICSHNIKINPDIIKFQHSKIGKKFAYEQTLRHREFSAIFCDNVGHKRMHLS